MVSSVLSNLTSHSRLNSPGIPKRRSTQSSRSRLNASNSSSSSQPKPSRNPDHDRELMTMLLVGEYREEVQEYMLQLDAETIPAVETMDLQPELEWFMRPFLIDFMIEIHQQYRLRPETLYLAVNIVDRYVAKRVVFKKHYQLVGCASLWIAAKYEDAKERVPGVGELSAMCCGAYEEASFVQMEGHVLTTIGWQLGHPTPEAFLRIRLADELSKSMTVTQSQSLQHSNTTLAHLTRFLMELSLFDRAFVGIRSVEIADGALMLARFILGLPCQGPEDNAGAKRVMNMLDEQLGERFSTISAVVVKKYNYGYFSRASRVVGDWYGAGHRLSRPAPPRSISSLSISSSPTSSVLTMSSSSRRSVAWSSPGSSVKAEEEEDAELEEKMMMMGEGKGATDLGPHRYQSAGLVESPTMPERLKNYHLSTSAPPPSPSIS